jgi:hypothetical protein
LTPWGCDRESEPEPTPLSLLTLRYVRSFLATLLPASLLLPLSRTTLLLTWRGLRLLLPLLSWRSLRLLLPLLSRRSLRLLLPLLLLGRGSALLRGDVVRRRADIGAGFVADRGGAGGRRPGGSVELGMMRHGRRGGSLALAPGSCHDRGVGQLHLSRQ